MGANGSSSSNNKKEERDIEIATAWLSSVNKKLAHDDLYTATAKSTSNNNNILTKPSLKPNNLIENNNTNNNNTNIIKLETTIKDDVEEIDESFFITDHREVTRLIDNQAKNMTNKLLNKKKNKSISKDVLNTNNTNNNTATVSDIQLVKSNKSSSKNRDNKKKHIAVLPTVPKIIITETPNYDFDPFAKYRKIPLIKTKEHASVNNMINTLDSLSLSSDDEADNNTQQNNINEDDTALQQPITPYLTKFEEIMIQLSGVPSGSGISMLPEEREKIILERQKQKQQIQDFIKTKRGLTTAKSTQTVGEKGKINSFNFNDSVEFD